MRVGMEKSVDDDLFVETFQQLTSRLDSLVSRMNKATSQTKVAAMADVINELVAQRKAMWGRMGAMMESRHGMMGNMPGRDTAP